MNLNELMKYQMALERFIDRHYYEVAMESNMEQATSLLDDAKEVSRMYREGVKNKDKNAIAEAEKLASKLQDKAEALKNSIPAAERNGRIFGIICAIFVILGGITAGAIMRFA